MIKILFTFIALTGLVQLSFSQKNDKKDSLYKFDNHETLSKRHYEEIQRQLDSCAERGDIDGLRLLSARLDAQMKLEEYLVKFREAEHAKFDLYWKFILTSAGSILATLLGVFVKQKVDARNVKENSNTKSTAENRSPS
jgi:N-acetylglucosamine kinase-like BadF-type ATPase